MWKPESSRGRRTTDTIISGLSAWGLEAWPRHTATTRAITAKMNDCCRAIVHVFIVRGPIRTYAPMHYYLVAFDASVVFRSLLVLCSAIFCDLFLCVRYLLLIGWPVATRVKTNNLFSIRFVLFDLYMCMGRGTGVCSPFLNCTHCWILFAYFPSYSSIVSTTELPVSSECRWERNLQKYQMREHKSSIISTASSSMGAMEEAQHNMRNICKERKTVKIKRVKIIVIIRWKDQHDQQLWRWKLEGVLSIFAYSYCQSPGPSTLSRTGSNSCCLLCSSDKMSMKYSIVIANFDVLSFVRLCWFCSTFYSFFCWKRDENARLFFSLSLFVAVSLFSQLGSLQKTIFILYPFLRNSHRKSKDIHLQYFT